MLESNRALDVAIEAGLQTFVACERVSLLKSIMWSRSSNHLLPDTDAEVFRDVRSEIKLWLKVAFQSYANAQTPWDLINEKGNKKKNFF